MGSINRATKKSFNLESFFTEYEIITAKIVESAVANSAKKILFKITRYIPIEVIYVNFPENRSIKLFNVNSEVTGFVKELAKITINGRKITGKTNIK